MRVSSALWLSGLLGLVLFAQLAQAQTRYEKCIEQCHGINDVNAWGNCVKRLCSNLPLEPSKPSPCDKWKTPC